MKSALLEPLLVVGAAAALVGSVHVVTTALTGPGNLPSPRLCAVDAVCTTASGTTSGTTTGGTTGATPCGHTPTSCGSYEPNCVVCPVPANDAATCTSSTCGYTCNTNYQPDGHGGCMPIPCGGTTASCGADLATTGCRDCTTSPPTGAIVGSWTCPASPTPPTCTYSCASPYMTCDGGHTCITCTAPANATPACKNGGCGFICNANYQPNAAGTGCDPSTCAQTVSQCGTAAPCRDCNAPAPAGASGASCVNAQCVYTCDATHKSCDGGATCASCPMPANSTPVCAGASCVFSCNSGYTASGSSCVSKSFATVY